MIPLVDLKSQYREIREEVVRAIDRVLETADFVLGAEVESFEAEFAAYLGASHAIGVNSGTSALHLALLAAGIDPGDEVLTVPFTFVATVAAIQYAGARPVFVDIDPRSLTMDVGRVDSAITARTKAIIPVHLYGQPVDMDPLLEIARSRNLVIIEDAAQAHGAEYKGRRVGTLGDFGCFSFYPGKNLGAYGEAGMVVTQDSESAARLRALRDWGQSTKYHHDLKGFNYRMEGIQGAVLRVKLRHLERWNDSRRSHAASYRRLLSAGGLQLPIEMPYARHVYHVFAVRHGKRDLLHQALAAEGIRTGIHYPFPVHLQKAYSDLGYRVGDFIHSEAAARSVLSLPMFPELTETQIRCISDRILAFIQTHGPGFDPAPD